MKIYIDEKEKYKDMKSTGFSFTLVGALGIIALVLVWLNIIPVNLGSSSRYLITIVMGALFLIFLIVGIKSFLDLKKIKGNISVQSETQDEVVSFFSSDKSIFDGLTYDEDITEEEKYLQKYEHLLTLIMSKYPDLSETDADHYAELIISKIDDENSVE